MLKIHWTAKLTNSDCVTISYYKKEINSVFCAINEKTWAENIETPGKVSDIGASGWSRTLSQVEKSTNEPDDGREK